MKAISIRQPWAPWAESVLRSRFDVPEYDDLPRGGIVGRAQIVGCVHESEKHLLCQDDAIWSGEPRCIVLADVEPLPFRPYKGALGLFEVPDELARAA